MTLRLAMIYLEIGIYQKQMEGFLAKYGFKWLSTNRTSIIGADSAEDIHYRYS